jgi:hypothetical protein
MADFFIDTLSLRIEGAAGHEHRIEPIARHAAALLASRLQHGSFPTARSEPSQSAAISGPAQGFDFTTVGDAEAAERIATAWLAAILPASASGDSSGK